MARRLVLSLTLASAVAACRPVPAPTTTASSNVEERLDRIEAALAKLTGDNGHTPATPEGRLRQLEQRLEKVIGFLKQAVRPELDETRTYAIPVDRLDPVVGPAGAKVTIVEAYEFLCPYCAMTAPVLDQLLTRYPKDVRLVSKYFLIHGEPAEPPGRAACAAAKQGKYPAMKKALWASIWPTAGAPADRERATADAIEKTAKGVGLDLTKFRADVASPDCATWIARSGETLQQFGASGTPAFYVNGRFVGGGKSIDELSSLVEAEIAKVDAATAAGVKAGHYYEEVVMKKGEEQAVMISPFD